MNIYDLSVNQLKRAAGIVLKNKSSVWARAERYFPFAGKFPQCTKGKADHERFSEKKDRGRSKSKMGEPSTSKTRDAFSQTCCQGQKENDERSSTKEGLSHARRRRADYITPSPPRRRLWYNLRDYRYAHILRALPCYLASLLRLGRKLTSEFRTA